MTLPTITALPTAPARTDAPDVFIPRADAFLAALAGLADDINAFGVEVSVIAASLGVVSADAELAALAALTSATDKLPYYTGAGTAGLTTFTAFARALLDDADAAAARATLGLGALALLATINGGNWSGTDLAVADGGTGASSAAAALANLGAAASGANTDITALDQDVTITATGTIAANSLGYRGLPQNSQAGAYALTLADAGKHIANTTGGFTIPANASVAFPIGTTIVLFNNSGTAQNVAVTTDTLRWAGTASTGTRSLLPYGLATIVKVAATTWAISGTIA